MPPAMSEIAPAPTQTASRIASAVTSWGYGVVLGWERWHGVVAAAAGVAAGLGAAAAMVAAVRFARSYVAGSPSTTCSASGAGSSALG